MKLLAVILTLVASQACYAELDLNQEVQSLEVSNVSIGEAIYRALEAVGENRDQYAIKIEAPAFVTVYDQKILHLERADRALIREYVFDQQKHLFEQLVERSPKEYDSTISLKMNRMSLRYVLEFIAATKRYEFEIEGEQIILNAERKLSVELVYSDLDPTNEKNLIDMLCRAKAAFSYTEKFDGFIIIRDHSLGSQRSTYLSADLSLIGLLKEEGKTTDEIEETLHQLYFGSSCIPGLE